MIGLQFVTHRVHNVHTSARKAAVKSLSTPLHTAPPVIKWGAKGCSIGERYSVSEGARTAVLVDEHPLWLDAVEQLLLGLETQTVGKATSLEEATLLIEHLQPEIVIAEIAAASSEEAGLAWLLDIRHRFEKTKIVVLSTCQDMSVIDDALAAGVAAYVVKRAHPDDLAVAIRQTFSHSIYFPASNGSSAKAAPAAQLDQLDLTRREVEILQLVAEGLSNAEIAKMLWVTEQTVKFHLSNIYRKLNVSNRTKASRWAQMNGLLLETPLRVSTT